MHPQSQAVERQFPAATLLVNVIAAGSAALEAKGVCCESDCTEILKSGVDDLPKSLIPLLLCHASTEPTPATKKAMRSCCDGFRRGDFIDIGPQSLSVDDAVEGGIMLPHGRRCLQVGGVEIALVYRAYV